MARTNHLIKHDPGKGIGCSFSGKIYTAICGGMEACMKLHKRVGCCLAAAAMLCSMVGCTTKDGDTANSGNTTLTYWVNLDSAAAMTVAELNETPFAKELIKETGIKVQYIHPPQGQAKEKFNIMMASDELPDIIVYDWSSYPGGPEKAINDGLIMDLTDKMEKNSPNLTKYLNEHQNVDKLVKTDSGKYFSYPFIRGDEALTTSAGLIVRKDWLNDLNMQVPETIEDWEQMLRAFKDKKGAKAPLSMQMSAFSWGSFVGAFGTTRAFYVEDGKVKYGPMQPEYKDFLTLMNNWYNEKLIDQNIASIDTKQIDANILNSDAGATAGSIGSGIGKWLGSSTDPKFDLIAAPYPVKNRGERSKFGQKQNVVTDSFAAISTSCKNVDLAMKFLDYGYGEKGHMLYNFGVEGESYTMEDGYPKYTDYITKNPDGLTMSAAMARYMESCSSGPFVQDIRYMEQYASLPQQQEAWKVWSNTDAGKYLMPITYVKQEESNEISKLMNAIGTYESEMLIKFIIGAEPIDHFDNYVEQLKQRGIERVLEIQQGAYERYSSR